jgi:hypothetical protein
LERNSLCFFLNDATSICVCTFTNGKIPYSVRKNCMYANRRIGHCYVWWPLIRAFVFRVACNGIGYVFH